jgi:hypothetical protein
MKKTQVERRLTYVTGLANQQLLLQNEYLLAENRIFEHICRPVLGRTWEKRVPPTDAADFEWLGLQQ